MLKGQWETFDSHRVTGWVLDADRLDVPVNVLVTINDVGLPMAPADMMRPDLEARFGSSYHGFNIDIMTALQPGFNIVSVTVAGGDFKFELPNRDLFHTPTDGAFGRALRKNPDLFLFDSNLKRSLEGSIPVRSEIGARRMAEVLSQTRLVFILFTNRSGSNVITDMLKHMGVGGGVTHEPFLADVMKEQIEKHGYTSIEHYLAQRIEAYSQNGTAFFKIGWDALFYLTESGVFNDALRNSCFIWARRRDKILQAISYIKAMKTGVFFEDGAATKASLPSFKSLWRGESSLREIAQAHHLMHISDMRLGYFLEMQGLSFFEAFYEDMNDDMQSFYDKLHAYVERNLDLKTNTPVFEPRLRKHESVDSVQIKELFLRLLRLPQTG